MLALLKKSPLSARIGLCIVLLNVLLAILAPVIAPYGETSVVGNVWESFSGQFYLGTDHLGRDLFTRMLYGARNTIALAFLTTAISFLMGTSLGFVAATKGGWIDQVFSRIIDIVMAFPTLIFALMIPLPYLIQHGCIVYRGPWLWTLR